MNGDREHQKAHIELAIERARERVGDTIDELDRRVKSGLDVKSLVKDHAVELAAAGGVLGLIVGFGVPRALIRLIQIGVPLAIAIEIVRRTSSGDDEHTTVGF
ncbi:MAG: hypothetical protein R3338_00660 [Thermoanaerobaculia bacterium]|nr:hypothetical protein [Thermoanaerobaculia bacterium]